MCTSYAVQTAKAVRRLIEEAKKRFFSVAGSFWYDGHTNYVFIYDTETRICVMNTGNTSLFGKPVRADQRRPSGGERTSRGSGDREEVERILTEQPQAASEPGGPKGWEPLLYLCFGALATRGVLFALVSTPYLIVVVQALDGVSAVVLGVTLPLMVADITRGTGRFNLGLGIVGSAVGIGAALSTTLAGYTIDHFGSSIAFYGLAFIAVCGLALVWLLLPETRPEADLPST